MSDERGERFLQDIKAGEERFKGKPKAGMMAEYVLGLFCEIDPSEHSRKHKCKTYT